jgi:hypothetical protein
LSFTIFQSHYAWKPDFAGQQAGMHPSIATFEPGMYIYLTSGMRCLVDVVPNIFSLAHVLPTATYNSLATNCPHLSEVRHRD